MYRIEQKIATWSSESPDYVGTQLQRYIQTICVDGWYVHNITTVLYQSDMHGYAKIKSCIIILHKQN